MNRIFPDYVYGPGPRQGCWWDETCNIPVRPAVSEDISCDVAIIGAGFTGLNSAIALARAGRDVVVLDAEDPGWGASGRNGGFCCLGGGMLSNSQLDRRYSVDDRKAWRAMELAAVDHVEQFLTVTGTDVDRHSRGETWLAHRSKDMHGIDEFARETEENYGVTPQVHSPRDLDASGMSVGFFGGMTTPVGFGLNPRKLLNELLTEVLEAGARVFGRSPVRGISRDRTNWALKCNKSRIRAQQVLIATNGYSAENLPDWLAGRYMPAQSSVLVTRPLAASELENQGWTSHQMCFDSRNLLHYFRLMPDNRMLFGMRGGLRGTKQSEQYSRRRLQHSFQKVFPAWGEVEKTHSWSGMVSLNRKFLPFIGRISGETGLYCAMSYHGNGVAMGSYAGDIVAKMMCEMAVPGLPEALSKPPPKFPFGSFRRSLMWPVYAGYYLADL